MTRLGIALAPALLAAALASCATVGPPPRNLAPPPGGEARDGRDPFRAWWTLYDDPALDAYVGRVLARVGDLSQTAGRVRSALALGEPEELALPPWETALWEKWRTPSPEGSREESRKAARDSLACLAVRAYLEVGAARARKELAHDLVRLARGTVLGSSRAAGRILSPLEREAAREHQSYADALYQLRRERFERAVRRFEILLGRYPRAERLLEVALPAPERGAFEGLLVEARRRAAARPALVRALEGLSGAAEREASAARGLSRAEASLRGAEGSTGRGALERAEREARDAWIEARRARLMQWAELASAAAMRPSAGGGAE